MGLGRCQFPLQPGVQVSGFLLCLLGISNRFVQSTFFIIRLFIAV